MQSLFHGCWNSSYSSPVHLLCEDYIPLPHLPTSQTTESPPFLNVYSTLFMKLIDLLPYCITHIVYGLPSLACGFFETSLFYPSLHPQYLIWHKKAFDKCLWNKSNFRMPKVNLAWVLYQLIESRNARKVEMGPKYIGKMKREGNSRTSAPVPELRARKRKKLVRLRFSPHCSSPRLEPR